MNGFVSWIGGKRLLRDVIVQHFPLNYDMYIVTHCAPTSIALKMDRHNEADRLTDFPETVRQRCEYDYWFMGHYHRDVTIDEKHFVQYRHISMIEPQENDT